MSLNAKTAGYVAAINVFIIVAICFVAGVTANPLALIGLIYLQDLPVFQEKPSMAMLRQEGMVGDEDDGYGDEYTGSGKFGFTAKT